MKRYIPLAVCAGLLTLATPAAPTFAADLGVGLAPRADRCARKFDRCMKWFSAHPAWCERKAARCEARMARRGAWGHGRIGLFHRNRVVEK